MSSFPTKSTGNSLKGLWFVFQDGQNRIHAWGSAATGKEKVFLNYHLVSERRNLKKQSAHLFQLTSDLYEIKFNTTSILKGHLECRLFKNGLLLKAISCKFIKKIGIPWKRWGILALLGIGTGLIAGYMKLSHSQYLLLMTPLFLSVFISRLVQQYTFEEIVAVHEQGETGQ